MSKRIALILFVVLVLALSACTRAASTPTLATATAAPNFPTAVPTQLDMSVIQQAATQTAMAQTGTPPGGQTDPVITTATPVFDPNATQSTVAATATPGTPVATTQPAATNVPAGSIARPTSYTLQTGEFPYCIARRYNLDPDELLALNGLTKAQDYYTAGTVLKIPQTGKAFPGSLWLIKHPAQYTVLSGETIYSIACKFGDVDPLEIARVNNIAAPYTLTAGVSLNIP